MKIFIQAESPEALRDAIASWIRRYAQQEENFAKVAIEGKKK